ncbi:unnamed protein product [Arctia plantaginis]|uniref:FP protein C-terminal domain-containing protein n=1 Tax=Arctia plantaginis TaxID=874455 RepID=A0A8S0Z8V8_ARCPL|nr:unnamed protein product [Arctia plantaginis]
MEYINILEEKVENLEISMKSSSLEIRNVPTKTQETKEDLIEIVKNIAQAVNTQIEPREIRDVYRMNSRKIQTNGPITAEFTTVIKRDELLANIKKYNRENKTNRINSSHISMNGTSPIYISEKLTTKAKKLLYQAREFSKANEYSYCWISHGKIYVKKREGATAKRINHEIDLEILKKEAM